MEAYKQQKLLRFAEAEATAAERRQWVLLAVQRIAQLEPKKRLDLHLREFLLWLLNIQPQELIKSYGELSAVAALCCSPEKAKTTVRKARVWNVILVTDNSYTTGGRRPNGYRLNWDGIRDLLTYRRLALDRHTPQNGQGLGDPVSGLGDPVSGLGDPMHIRNTLLLSSLETPDPDPGAGTGPGDFQERANGGSPIAAAGSVAVAEPRAIPDLPELVEARRMPVSPLPAGDLLYGLWHGIAREHLAARAKIVGWFRRQLTLAQPVCDGHQADLLLVLAAARRADQIPQSEITKSRVGLFCGIVVHRRWHRVLRYVPDARQWLDRLLKHFPEALSAPDWPPKPKEP